MTTQQLNEFYILAATLSYSEAAEKLFISQSTLSRHIKNMEEELNVRLFSRTTRTVELTSEGKFFQSQIPRLLKKSLDIESLLNLEPINANGRIKMICSAQTLNRRILQFLHDFQEHYRNIHLDLELLSKESGIDTVYNADILLTPCDYTIKSPDIDAMLVTSQPALLAVPPHHHLGEEHSASLFDLRNETLIVPVEEDMAGPYAQLSYLATRKCYGHLAKIAASSVEQALLQVELGHGVMILPHHLKYHVYAHTLTVAVSDPECFFPIYAYHNRGIANGAATLLFTCLTERFQKKPI